MLGDSLVRRNRVTVDLLVAAATAFRGADGHWPAGLHGWSGVDVDSPMEHGCGCSWSCRAARAGRQPQDPLARRSVRFRFDLSYPERSRRRVRRPAACGLDDPVGHGPEAGASGWTARAGVSSLWSPRTSTALQRRPCNGSAPRCGTGMAVPPVTSSGGDTSPACRRTCASRRERERSRGPATTPPWRDGCGRAARPPHRSSHG